MPVQASVNGVGRGGFAGGAWPGRHRRMRADKTGVAGRVSLWATFPTPFKVVQQTLTFETPGRSSRDITRDVAEVVARAGIRSGLAHVFIKHTSASLMICENADPSVREDVERWLARAVPDGDPMYRHRMEGPDDMPGHIRAILTGMDVTVPVTDGALNLGTWQGIYLYEHRSAPHSREVVVTLT